MTRRDVLGHQIVFSVYINSFNDRQQTIFLRKCRGNYKWIALQLKMAKDYSWDAILDGEIITVLVGL
jgi:hypothetical protein